MTDFAVVEYKELFTGHITFKRNGMINFAHDSVTMRDAVRKMACFRLSGDEYGARSYIDYNMDCAAPKKLYICPECRTPRDLFRNTGYKIVRDKESADAIVVPDASVINCMIQFANVAFLDKENLRLYLYTANKDWMPLSDNDVRIEDGDLDKIKKAYLSNYGKDLSSDKYECFFSEVQKRFPVEFLPIIQEYKEILTGTRPKNYKYLSEGEIYINCPTEITPETLSIWHKTSDYNILANSIAASNWRDYPVTLFMFVSIFKPNVSHYGGQKFKLVLDSIGYNYYESIDKLLLGRIIQPDDWNMFQEFLMTYLGVPEDGGFGKKKGGPENNVLKYVRSRIAIKPLKINTPTSWENIKEMLKM